MSELSFKSSANENRTHVPNHRRRIVSYFDHEFLGPSLEKVERDVSEMVGAGFTNVVLCISEKDIASRMRLDFLTDTVSHMQRQGLEVWADPWGVGGVFGGEAESRLKNGSLDALLNHWLNAVATTGTKTVFWDEPEMKDHAAADLKLLHKYTRQAGRLALASVVCLSANEIKKHQLIEVAALPDVIEIATDPYYPNAFSEIPESKRLDYVGEWASYTYDVARAAGIRSHIWVQAFGIPNGREAMIGEHIAVCRERGINDIAIWGFHGCESVPDFVNEGDAPPRVLWDVAKVELAKS